MRHRIICCVAFAAAGVIVLMYYLGGSRVFPILGKSELESLYADGDTVRLGGQIYRKIKKEDNWVLYLKRIRIQRQDESEYEAEENLLVYLSNEQEERVPEYGQYIRVSGTISFFQDAPNPGNFNQRFYYQKQGITGALKRAKIEEIRACRGKGRWKYRILECMSVIRERTAEQILAYLGEEKGGALCSMMLGDRAYMDEEVRETYQKSGIGHLLAISGLHVSFVGMGLYEILRRVSLTRTFAAGGSSAVLLLYAVMTGGSVSAVRAAVMFLIHMGAEVTGREYDGLTAAGTAMLFMLVSNPLHLFDAGFLLSFGAVLGIYLILPLWQTEGEAKWKRTVKMSVSVQMAVLPVMLYYYYEISPYSIFWNLIAVPLAGIVLAGGFTGMMILAAVPQAIWLAQIPYGICSVILGVYEEGSRIMLEIPGARWVAGRPGIVQILAYYMVLAAVLAFFRHGKKKAAYAGILAAVLLMGLPHGKAGELEIYMMNVGQGDACFLRGPKGGTYLIDGGSSTVSEVGKYRIEPFLKSVGVGKLDYVWVSHGDIDHLGGIEEMLKRQKCGIRIERMVLPKERFWDDKLYELAQTAAEYGTKIYTVNAGQILREGEMELRCIWPGEEEDEEAETMPEPGNEASMVLALRYRKFDMLFTGDLENDAEQTVAARIEQLQKSKMLSTKFEVLKVGHHGSRNATSDRLLEITLPEAAWVSAGEKNRYGHPHEEVL
ncbi:MAG: DNA internalization-related competence protein ComEC/Rec2, partial [Bariatricus sp.]